MVKSTGISSQLSQIASRQGFRHCRWWIEPCTSTTPLLGEAGFLELTVDIAGDHEVVEAEALDPGEQQAEAEVRYGGPIEIGAVAVKAPAEGRVPLEVGGIGGAYEIDAEPPVHRIGGPEPLIAAEIGESGINPHPRPGGDDQRPRLPEGLRRPLQNLSSSSMTLYLQE